MSASSHTAHAAAEAWRRRVEAHHAQSLAVMEESMKRGDFWRKRAPMFRANPRRTDDDALNAIAELVDADSTLLDVGGGAGRFAVALSLRCRRATMVEPSESMLAQLREAADEAGASNVRAVQSEWETAKVDTADVVLCSHVVYGVADIAPFVEKLIVHANRTVAMLMFVDSPQASVSRLWEPVHGERRIDLPALPELMNVLWEMGVYPNVRMLASSPSHTFESVETAVDAVAVRLFIGNDAGARRRLEERIEDYLEPSADGYRMRGSRRPRQGLIWWEASEP